MDIDGNPRRGDHEMETIQAQIEHIKQKCRLVESERRALQEAHEEELEENRKQISSLLKDIDSNYVLLEKGRLSDEKIIKKAFQKFPSDMRLIKDKRPGEVAALLEDRVFDLTKKRDRLAAELRQKDNTLLLAKADLKDIEGRCQSQEEDPDKDLAEKVEDVHIDFEEVKTRVSEMQKVQRSYQEMVQNLSSDILIMPTKLDQVELEYNKQQAEIVQLLKRGERADKFRAKALTKFQEVEADAAIGRQDKDRVVAEMNRVKQQKPSSTREDDMKRASTKTTPADELNKMKKQQETQLQQYREAFEQIKVATGVTDIEDSEKRFASQMETKKRLKNCKKRLQKKFAALRKKEAQFEAQKQMMLAAGLANPEQTIEDKLAELKASFEEQSKRKEKAREECKRISQNVKDVKVSLWQSLQMMEHQFYGYEIIPASSMPDIPMSELVSRVKNMLQKITEGLDSQDIDSLVRLVKEDHSFVGDLESGSASTLSAFRRPKPKPEEVGETNSEEEEEEAYKRSIIEAKKEDRNYANLKEKQKGGKGRNRKL